VVKQWERARLVQPSIVDQRTIVEVDGHLLGGASAARGVLDRVAKLASNRRAVPVASGLGSQLGPLMFRREAPAIQSDAG
jgi:hypothetical protein